MNKKNFSDKKIVVFMIVWMVLIINFIITPTLIVVQVFAFIYSILIYKYFNESISKALYYFTLLFSIINYSLAIQISSRYQIYYMYITLFFYFTVNFYIQFKKNAFSNIKSKIRSKFNSDFYFRFLIIFIVYLLVGIYFAANKRLALSISVVYFLMIPFSLMIINENKSKKDIIETMKFLEHLYVGVLILGTIEILGIRYGIRTNYMESNINVLKSSYYMRIPIVFFYNQNNYAMFLVMGVAGFFSKIIFSKSKKEIFLSNIIILISQINLIFATSRICWITLVLLYFAGIVVFLVIKEKRNAFVSFKYMIYTLIIFGILSMVPMVNTYYGKFDSTPILKMFNINYLSKYNNLNKVSQIQNNEINSIISNKESGSLNERYYLIKNILRGVFIDKHLLGFGVGNSMNYIKKANNTFGVLNPHSMWFEILGDFGVIIFLYYVYMYFKTIKSLLYSYAKYKGNKLSIFGLLLSLEMIIFIILSFAPSTVLAYTPFWILLALSISMTKIAKLEEKQV